MALRAPRSARPKRLPLRSARLLVEQLEDRTMLNGGPLTLVDGVPDTESGTLAAGASDWYSFQLPANSLDRVQARVQPDPGLQTRLSLYIDDAASPRLLIQSGALSATDSENLIDQHLFDFPSGTPFLLQVQALTGTGNYSLTTELQTAFLPFEGIPVGSGAFGAFALTSGDFNGDGAPDIAVADGADNQVIILLNVGDGSFQQAGAPINVGTNPQSIVTGNFFGNGQTDLAVVNQGDGTVTPLENMGNGQFTCMPAVAVGTDPRGAVAGFFDADGLTDLAVANFGSDSVTVLLNDPLSPGMFTTAPVPLAVGSHPIALAAGDFFGAGHTDLAVADHGTNDVVLLQNNGVGTFLVTGSATPVGMNPIGIVAGDFNSDGTTDLATADQGLNTDALGTTATVTVLFNDGYGTLTAGSSVAIGNTPQAITAGDFNGDGSLDIATGNSNQTDQSDVSVLSNDGTGRFTPATAFYAGFIPEALISADLNKDGHPDLVVAANLFAQGESTDVSVLPNDGTGQFTPPTFNLGLNEFSVDRGPNALTTGDFNGDGRLDVVTANSRSNDFSVVPGNGAGIFLPQTSSPLGQDTPFAVVSADFNRDGREDLAFVNQGSNTVSILLGLGDGTFRLAHPPIPVGPNPSDIVAADFGNGQIDLAVANTGSTGPNGVIILLGDGTGNFTVAESVDAGLNPIALAVGDFFSNGLMDLAVANNGSTGPAGVSLLMNDGSGHFTRAGSEAAGTNPFALTAADFNNDGKTDLAVVNISSSDVTVLLNTGGGTFSSQSFLADPGVNPLDIVAADLNGDHNQDLVITNGNGSTIINVFLGDGTGAFFFDGGYVTGITPEAVRLADFNGDGHLDLVTANVGSNDIGILLGNGDGTFFSPTSVASASGATPLLGDLDGNGTTDAVVLNGQGQILFRPGLGNGVGNFGAPVIVNSVPARDIAVIHLNGQTVVAALDSRTPTVTFYADGPGGFVAQSGLMLPAGEQFPAHIAGGDLNDDGLDDLVVAGSSTAQVFVYLQNPDGSLGAPAGQPNAVLPTGIKPADILLANVAGHTDGEKDILVTDQFSGDVSVLVNSPSGFDSSAALRFRAGAGYFSADGVGLDGGFEEAVRMALGPVGVAAGAFSGGPATDLVVADEQAHTVDLLAGDGTGGVRAPQVIATGGNPTLVVSGRFTASPNLDIAVLDESADTIRVYLGDGHGGFTLDTNVDGQGDSVLLAGDSPTGLTTAVVNGQVSLLVGNSFGDILVIQGKGDGTFQPFLRTDQSVPFVVSDFNGDGTNDVLLANQAADQALIQLRLLGTNSFTPGGFFQNRTNGLEAPGNVAIADVNGDGIPDRIVANSGSNNIFVYLSQSNGTFKQLSFTVGTNPVGLAVLDLNGDGVPDVAVANEGSNDVSMLFGQGKGDSWTTSPGPRLKVGAGPIAVSFADANGDGIPDLVTANSQDGTLTVLPGIGANGQGTGFFNDAQPTTLHFASTAAQPTQLLQVDTTDNLALATSGAIFRFSLSGAGLGAPVFTATGVTATFVTGITLAGEIQPTLFLGTADGGIELLTPGPGGQYTDSANLTDPRLGDISQIEVVQVLPDTFELYVTNEDDPLPIIIDFPIPTSGTPTSIIPLLTILPGAAGLTSLNPNSVETVATLSVIEVIQLQFIQPARFTANELDELTLNTESLLGVLTATALVDTGAGEGGLINSGEIRNDGDDGVPTADPAEGSALESFVTGVRRQLQEALSAQENYAGGPGLGIAGWQSVYQAVLTAERRADLKAASERIVELFQDATPLPNASFGGGLSGDGDLGGAARAVGRALQSIGTVIGQSGALFPDLVMPAGVTPPPREVPLTPPIREEIKGSSHHWKPAEAVDTQPGQFVEDNGLRHPLLMASLAFGVLGLGNQHPDDRERRKEERPRLTRWAWFEELRRG